jgi:hypothetical protein
MRIYLLVERGRCLHLHAQGVLGTREQNLAGVALTRNIDVYSWARLMTQ